MNSVGRASGGGCNVFELEAYTDDIHAVDPHTCLIVHLCHLCVQKRSICWVSWLVMRSLTV